jgi:hypothetical protein
MPRRQTLYLGTYKRPRHMTLAIHVQAWEKHTYVAALNRVMGSQSSPLDNWSYNATLPLHCPCHGAIHFGDIM